MFFQAEDGIRDLVRSRGLGDVYKRQGVVAGGEQRQVFRKLPVRCLPKDIPVKLVHDITELELDESLPVSYTHLTLPTSDLV